MNRGHWLAPGLVALLFITFTCARSPEPAEGASSTAAMQTQPREQVIEHLLPKRDSVGGVPEKFEWTSVAGADHYTVGLWNEVDRMIWKQDVGTSSIAWPAGQTLDMGTYYWSVTAWSKDRAIAASGLAAFVVIR